MFRFTILVFTIAAIAGCSTPPAVSDSPLQTRERDTDAALDQQLTKPIDIHIGGERFDNVIEWFRREAGVNVIVDWAALKKAGIDADTPIIELELTQVPARRVFELILRRVEAQGYLEPIGYTAQDNIIHISTRNDLRRAAEARTYDISELMSPPVQRWTLVSPDDPEIRLSKPDESERPTPEELSEQVFTLIQDVTGSPRDWQNFGGEVGSIHPRGPTLNLRVTPEHHREIEALLISLHEQTRRLRLHNEREFEIAAWLTRANRLRLNGDYEAALAETDKALRVLPDHTVAVAMRQLITGIQQRSARGASGVGGGVEGKPAASLVVTIDAGMRAAPTRATQERLSPADRELWRKLDQPITVDYRDITLKAALRQFAKSTGVNLFTDWALLEACGVEMDAPVMLRLREVPAAAVLQVMLADVHAAADIEPLDFDVQDGIVIVTTARDLARRTVTQQHDISDLLAWRLDPLALQGLEDEAGEPGQRDSSELVLTREEMIEHIVSLIQDDVGAMSEWAAYGGDISSLRELNSMLIIKTRPVHHAEIRALLAILRSRMIDRLERTLAEQAIAPLLAQADELRLKDRHADALKLVEQALVIRPDHPQALAKRTVLKESIDRSKK